MLRENDFRPLASLASCGKRGVLAGAVAVTRSQQKTVNFVGTCLQGDARDLSARIVAECLDQKQGGISGNQGIEVRITPFCQRKARLFPFLSNDPPTTWPLLLMPSAKLATSPGSVPRSVITPFCQRKA